MDAVAVVLDLQQLVATLLDNDVDLSGSCVCTALLKTPEQACLAACTRYTPARLSVSPASKLFSTSSLSALTGRCITSPAAMRFTTASSSLYMRGGSSMCSQAASMRLLALVSLCACPVHCLTSLKPLQALTSQVQEELLRSCKPLLTALHTPVDRRADK